MANTPNNHDVKCITQALAILSASEKAVEADYNDAMAKAISEVETKFALRLRAIRGARQSVLDRFIEAKALEEEYYGRPMADIPTATRVRLRRSLRRERE